MPTYIENSEADLYFESRYNSGLWDETSEADKTKLLATASRYLQSLNWAGDKADEDQELEFPRGDDTDIPDDIKNAVCEIAYALLDGRDIEFERELIGQSSAAAAGSRTTTDPDTVDVAKLHGIPSTVAWNLIRPYLRDGSAITLVRLD
jgi:hypothetical protein